MGHGKCQGCLTRLSGTATRRPGDLLLPPTQQHAQGKMIRACDINMCKHTLIYAHSDICAADSDKCVISVSWQHDTRDIKKTCDINIRCHMCTCDMNIRDMSHVTCDMNIRDMPHEDSRHVTSTSQVKRCSKKSHV